MRFWGCSHRKTSFPITLGKGPKKTEVPKRTYIVCLDCGKELPYSWEEMAVVKTQKNGAAAPEYQPALS
jgi:hypothetical protein